MEFYTTDLEVVAALLLVAAMIVTAILGAAMAGYIALRAGILSFGLFKQVRKRFSARKTVQTSTPR